MNQEKLNYIASQPSEINTEDARELEELTRNFPFFTLPYVLLTKYYASTNDYRFEDTLHKTALRVNDRAWLHTFIHSQTQIPLAAEVSVSLNTENEVNHTENIHFDNEIDITDEIYKDSKSTNEASETLSEVSNPNDEIAAEQPADEALEVIPESIPSPLAEDNGLMDTMELTSVSSMIEFDLSPTEFESDTEDYPVYEEIVSFDENINPEQTPEVEATDHLQVFELRELIIEPDQAPMADNETIAAEEIDEPLDEPLIEDSNQKAVLPLYTAGSVYNIEDYYPSIPNNQAPGDFFSWLSNPEYKAQARETTKIEASTSHKTELIDKFIKNKPVVSQPKSDFFNAMDVAKRSDSLPVGLATETLASVYMQQGNFTGAIRIYEALVLKIPQKSAYFAALIEKIKKEHL